jgi:hypothetical protein
MKIALLLFLLCLNICASSQKIESDKVDEFEGHREITSSRERISPKTFSSVGLSAMVSALCIELDGTRDTSFNVYLIFRTTGVTSLDKNSIIFLFEDGSKFSTKNQSSYKLLSDDDFAGVYFDLNWEQMREFHEKKIKKVRIETTRKNYDFEIDDKKTEMVPALVSLVLDRVVQPIK